MARVFKAIVPITAALISGVLLFASFPPFDLSFLIWIALVPLFIAIMGKRPVYAFFLSFVCSVTFFTGLMIWIFEVPAYRFLHHYALALYLGPCFGLFGLALSCISRRWSTIAALFAAPFVWVSLEYVRSNFFFLALPWGLLAHSQYNNPMVIQIASVTGAYGVSFLIVMFNAAVGALVLLMVHRVKKEKPTFETPVTKQGSTGIVVTAVILLGATFFYGHMTVSKPITGDAIKVSVVQGSFEHGRNRNPKYGKSIMQTYADLTLEASKDNPSLIVWPEGSAPGLINLKPRLYARLRSVAQTSGRYLLFGSSKRQKFTKKESGEAKSLNSAYLISPQEGAKSQHYNKIRLLPFGEYTPLEKIIPWSYINIPEVSEYAPGEDFTVFKIPLARFAVTICWENVFPEMARQFVKRGAQFIVNITNEAWFGRTAAPYQFLSMSVFRAVENRVYVVRCANTGVSCFIDPYGRVVDRVRDKDGQDIFVRGILTGSVIPLESRTFYTRYGDWLAWLCLSFSVGFILFALLKKETVHGSAFKGSEVRD